MALINSKNNKPDLDSPEHIAVFVETFYTCLLRDNHLAPIFTDVAGIDIVEHLPRIQAYWEKLLLGENNYQRHTMNIHRQLDAMQRLSGRDFDQWLGYFIQSADSGFTGPKTERAKRIATTISENMRRALSVNS
jgi:hemoglobin